MDELRKPIRRSRSDKAGSGQRSTSTSKVQSGEDTTPTAALVVTAPLQRTICCVALCMIARISALTPNTAPPSPSRTCPHLILIASPRPNLSIGQLARLPSVRKSVETRAGAGTARPADRLSAYDACRPCVRLASGTATRPRHCGSDLEPIDLLSLSAEIPSRSRCLSIALCVAPVTTYEIRFNRDIFRHSVRCADLISRRWPSLPDGLAGTRQSARPSSRPTLCSRRLRL